MSEQVQPFPLSPSPSLPPHHPPTMHVSAEQSGIIDGKLDDVL